MGELLDRKLQQKILETAASEYPGHVRYGSGRSFASNAEVVNAAYLHEHGLVRVAWPNEFERHTLRSVTITAKGLDFLANDGGLSAILGVVTIKLHEDSIRSCPAEWCSFGNRRAFRTEPGIGQLAAGRLMSGSSLIVAIVSSVM